MKYILRVIWTRLGFIIFTLLFLLFVPFYLVIIWFPNSVFSQKLYRVINRAWAWCLWKSILIPVKITGLEKINKNQVYIICANHFSHLDIPLIGLLPLPLCFMGKKDHEKIPLFGYMYKNLHITLDRSSPRNARMAYEQAKEKIDKRISVIIYPEGGISSKEIPTMARFKNGAFKLAIEKQTPILPLAIPYNWVILPDTQFLLSWKRNKLVVLDPIHPEQKTVEELKKEVFESIQKSINHEDR